MIIDFHIHTFPDAIAERVLKKISQATGLTPCSDGTVNGTRAKMDEWNIDKAVILNIATSPSQQNTINNVAAQNNRSDRFRAFGSVFPFADDAEEELKRIKSLGLKGIKLHPEYQDFYIDDERLFGIYETCSDLGLAITFHTGADLGYGPPVHATPDRVLRVIRNFPKLKVIAAHFGGFMFWDAVRHFLIGENIYLDTSFTYGWIEPERMRQMILDHGTDKILFASDCPWESPADSLKTIQKLNLPAADTDRILGQNALDILES